MRAHASHLLTCALTLRHVLTLTCAHTHTHSLTDTMGLQGITSQLAWGRASGPSDQNVCSGLSPLPTSCSILQLLASCRRWSLKVPSDLRWQTQSLTGRAWCWWAACPCFSPLLPSVTMEPIFWFPLNWSWSFPSTCPRLLPVKLFSSVQSLSCVRFLATPWTAARQASLSITNSQSLLKLMSVESVMPSHHLILHRPLLLLPSIFPSISLFQ